MRIWSAVSRTHSTNAQRNKRNYVQRGSSLTKQHAQPSPKNLMSNIGMVNDNMVMGVTTMMVGGYQLHKS